MNIINIIFISSNIKNLKKNLKKKLNIIKIIIIKKTVKKKSN